ncbi:hypothetical protein Golob_004224, partial [Gossypium lobatum]|nr:hypothetical protein [Gossypium lobatum]
IYEFNPRKALFQTICKTTKAFFFNFFFLYLHFLPIYMNSIQEEFHSKPYASLGMKTGGKRKIKIKIIENEDNRLIS